MCSHTGNSVKQLEAQLSRHQIDVDAERRKQEQQKLQQQQQALRQLNLMQRLIVVSRFIYASGSHHMIWIALRNSGF